MWPLSLLHFLLSHCGIIKAFLLLSVCVFVCVRPVQSLLSHTRSGLQPVADGSFQVISTFYDVPTFILSSFTVTQSLFVICLFVCMNLVLICLLTSIYINILHVEVCVPHSLNLRICY